MIIEILLESLLETPKNEILSECEEVLLEISQLEINCSKEYQKKQIKYAVLIYKEIRDTTMEDSK